VITSLSGNPLQSTDFHVPTARHDQLRAISAQQGGDDPGHVDPADIPFNRMVDAWLLAVALGVAAQTFALVGGEGITLKKVTALNVINNDPSAIAFLMNIAVAHEHDPYVVEDPASVVRIADGYAVGGFEILFDMMGGHSGGMLFNLSKALGEYAPKSENGGSSAS
jgi:hypothetical protein